MRAVAFALIVFALQSALYVLLPAGFAVPDVVLLVALTAATRLEPTIGLTLGFGLGFLQDVLGAGVLGFHAAGAVHSLSPHLPVLFSDKDTGPVPPSIWRAFERRVWYIDVRMLEAGALRFVVLYERPARPHQRRECFVG